MPDFLEERRHLLGDFVEAVLAPLSQNLRIATGSVDQNQHLNRVHLVNRDNELAYAERIRKQRMLARLPILVDPSLKLTCTSSDDENGAVRLGGARDHVLDEVPVPRGVDDLSRNV